MTVKELENKIVECSKKYYEGNQIVTDDQFDSLLDKLRELDPDSPILSSVGWGGGKILKRFKSPHHGNSLVSGLNKIKYPGKFPKIENQECYVITPKIDGGSWVLYYVNGTPFSLVSRGDGKEGYNTLHKFPNKFPEIPFKGLIGFRCESYVPLEKFEELKKRGVPNPRNFSAGVMNRDAGSEDPDLIYVDFLFYQIKCMYPSCDNDNSLVNLIKTKEDILNFLDKMRLPTVYFGITHNLEKRPSEEFSSYLFKEWSNIIPIDGVVVTKNSSVCFKDKDIVEDSFAYKFEGDTAQVVVKDIAWSLGSSGRLNPVVEYEPVFLCGAELSAATGFNAAFVKDNGIGPGSIVEITRSNDVIPYIIDTIFPVEVSLPEVCPKCGNLLIFDDTFLKCDNPQCGGIMSGAIRRVLSLVDPPLGLGGKMIDLIIDNVGKEKEEDISLKEFLYCLIKGSFCVENFVDTPHAKKLIFDHLHNIREYISKSFTVSDFWFILNLENLARKNADKITTHPKDFIEYENLSTKGTVPYNAIEAMGRSKTLIKEIFSVLKEFEIEIRENVEEEKSEKIKICYTGATDKFPKRGDFFNHYKDRVEESPVGKAQYLICNSPSNSSKYKTAIEKRIPIVTENEMVNILES